MKIGVRAHDFGRKSAVELAATIRESGFECVQLAMTKAIEGIDSFGMVTEQRVDEAAEAFAKVGVEISIYGCYIEPAMEDTATRLEQVAFFCEGVRLAKRINAPIIATETTNFPIGGEGREAAYLRMRDSVQRMAEAAEKYDVTIGIEPVFRHTLYSAELTRRLQEEVNSDKLKVVFDPVNMLMPYNADKQLEIYAQFIETLGDDIVAMHIKDVTVEGDKFKWANIGDGIVDFSTIMSWLKQHKPDMHLLREEVHPESFERDLSAMCELARG